MEAKPVEPLVGPVLRRGWREITRLAPLASSPHVALVITRRGRLASIIPAYARRTLSDYLDLPFEYREVDMRERLLELDLRLDSRDIGYSFLAVLRLVYRVARPERVAIDHADVLRELEEAIIHRTRAIARSLGVEQSNLLKEYLFDALITGNELPTRFDELGLSLIRADVAIELDVNARERAAVIHEQARNRPLVLNIQIESHHPGVMFDVLIGGFYRTLDRDRPALSAKTAEQIIQRAAIDTLQRVGAIFTPEQEQAAAAAMAEELWSNTFFKAALATENLELLRPSIQIQSGSAAPETPLPPERAAPELEPDNPLATPERAPATHEAEDVDWDALGAGLSFTTTKGQDYTHPGWMAQSDDDEEPTPPPWVMPLQDDPTQPLDAKPDTSETAPTGHVDDRPPDWVAWRAAFEQPPTLAADSENLPSWLSEPQPAQHEEVKHPAAHLPIHELVARWVELLRAQDSESFQFWGRLIVSNPELTGNIISGLTNDPVLRDRVDDPRCRQLLAETLQAVLELEGGDLQKTSPASEPPPTEQEPDWLIFRRSLDTNDNE